MNTRTSDMAQARALAAAIFASPGKLPFSFCYAGQEIHGIPDSWSPVATRRTIDANIVETVVEGSDSDTGVAIRFELREYLDFPVSEWVVWFTNAGAGPTPVLSDIRAMDVILTGREPVLQSCNGDFCSADGYTPQETAVAPGVELRFAPSGGRPCDGAFPYFRLQFEGRGLTLAVGWPAQWSASFSGVEGGVAVTAGQEQTNLRLMPGEAIRTPRMTAMSWVGDTARAVNLWRRWYMTHILPRSDGQPLGPLLAVCGTDAGEEFTAATAENQLRYQERFSQAGTDYDVWWVDAGWYPCKDAQGDRHWVLTGTWVPDPDRFPAGLKPVSEHAASHGARLLLWFEPERVVAGSQLRQEHPDWLLHSGAAEGWEDQNALLNLGNPECRQWLTDHVCTLIERDGIGVYRQDFNFPPLAYWRDSEAADRQGMNENLHVQGYLRYWDDLLARNPGLWIDSCASGGRRNDLETMRRSVPLHYSDYGYGNHPVKLAFHHTLFAWIPYFKDVTLSWDMNLPGEDGRFDKALDSFSFHCGLAAMLFVSVDIRRDDYDFALGRKMVELWHRAAPLMLDGDYYPCTPFSRSGAEWVAWQFDRPELGCGMLQGIRHSACPDESFTMYPKGLNPDFDYVFEAPETGDRVCLSGATVMREGFVLALPRRSGVVWFYQKGVPM